MNDLEVKNKVILAVGAHPDDLEFGCGGTVAKWVSEGAEVYYLITTDGSKGSEDPKILHKDFVEIRHKEQEEAAKVLGVKKVFFLDFVDGEFEVNHVTRKEIVKIIRKLKPEIVITWDPTYFYSVENGRINHPDHRNTGEAVLDCVFPFARNARTYPELLEEDLNVHSVKEVLLFNREMSNFFVDISKTFDKKIEALSKHQSQFNNFEDVKKMVTNWVKRAGEKAGSDYAEGFLRISIAG